MALCKLGNSITGITGQCGGVYFSRDRSGVHSCAMPRNIRQRSNAQNTQRKAFTKARAYSKVNRFVSYNIYRALNDLEPCDPPNDFYPNMR